MRVPVPVFPSDKCLRELFCNPYNVGLSLRKRWFPFRDQFFSLSHRDAVLPGLVDRHGGLVLFPNGDRKLEETGLDPGTGG